MKHPVSVPLFLISAGILLVWSYTPVFASPVSGPLFATTATESFYVSPQGNDDNPGTESQPWHTVEKAAESAQAGQTIYFMEGVYPGKLRPRHSGTEGNLITFTSYPGQTATIDGGKKTKGSYGGVVDIQRKSHLVISNLHIINAEHFGVRVEDSAHILIQGNMTDFTFSSGIYVAASRQVIVDGNEVRRACHGEGGLSPQEHISVRGGTDGFVIRNNYVHTLNDGKGKEGINIKEGAANGKVYNNVVDGMRRTGLYVDGYDDYVTNVEIYGNVVTNSLHGIVLASEHRGTVSNLSIYNNIFHNNQNNGVWVTAYLEGGKMDNIRIVNNTIYNNVKRGISITNPEATNVLIRNNIILKNGEQAIYVSSGVPAVTMDYNMVEGDALFIDSPAGDFRLQTASPAVDSGTPGDAPLVDFMGTVRPSGNGHDKGAFELVSTEQPQQQPPQQGAPQQGTTEIFLPALSR
jgi:polygalacturonase